MQPQPRAPGVTVYGVELFVFTVLLLAWERIRQGIGGGAPFDAVAVHCVLAAEVIMLLVFSTFLHAPAMHLGYFHIALALWASHGAFLIDYTVEPANSACVLFGGPSFAWPTLSAVTLAGLTLVVLAAAASAPRDMLWSVQVSWADGFVLIVVGVRAALAARLSATAPVPSWVAFVVFTLFVGAIAFQACVYAIVASRGADGFEWIYTVSRITKRVMCVFTACVAVVCDDRHNAPAWPLPCFLAVALLYQLFSFFATDGLPPPPPPADPPSAPSAPTDPPVHQAAAAALAWNAYQFQHLPPVPSPMVGPSTGYFAQALPHSQRVGGSVKKTA